MTGAKAPPRPAQALSGWLRWFWRTLTSMRQAVALLVLLALAAIPGSLLPQRGVSSSPLAVQRFFDENPGISPWLDRLGLFHVYSTPWFAAIYLLLLISMMGCVLPRCARLWAATRQPPPPGPGSLRRLDDFADVTTDQDADTLLPQAENELRRRGFRVVRSGTEVRGEIGYLRELGNLAFHLSLLILLMGIGYGKLWGYEGRVAFVEGGSFSNTPSQYDEFTPAVLTDLAGLEPFVLTLQELDVAFETDGPTRGQPRRFDAAITAETLDDTRSQVIRPNEPLNVNGTKVFLTGQGYAPEVTVRDGAGRSVFTGPVIFLPIDGSYASDGVIKAPSALPTQLGFEGLFLPTAAFGPGGPYSAFPDALDPRLILSAYSGDLGMDAEAQSVFLLNKDGLDQVERAGQPFVRALRIGETMRLPGGVGSVTFDGISRFANVQIAYDPGKEISLVAGIMLMLGLTTSLAIRRRRVWIRVESTSTSSCRLAVAGLPLTRRGLRPGEIPAIVDALCTRATLTSIDQPEQSGAHRDR